MNIKTLLIAVLVFGGFFAVSAAAKSIRAAASGIKKISAAEGFALLNENPNVTLVDVRTLPEYADAHIPGAILIPNETIRAERPKELPDLNAKIVVYCRSGARSADAAYKLSKMGYTDITDLGGIMYWKYQTVSGQQKGTWKTK
ncbi:MAG: rhodanese-like domain-containing protein [Treponema sp.]